MIWIIVFGVIVIAVSAVIIWAIHTCQSMKPVPFAAMITIGVISFIMIIIAGITQLDTDHINEQNVASYEELMLYRDVVQNSNDELLRWDYYQKIQKWNDEYENYLEGRNSVWRSAYFGCRDYDGCDFISFDLKRD